MSDIPVEETPIEGKRLLVFGEKTFRITVPDGCRVTSGPWSPPSNKGYSSDRAMAGTLRIYRGSQSAGNIIAVFSGVTGFREDSLDYEEQVAKEEGAAIWKSDRNGYKREGSRKVEYEWTDPAKQLIAPAGEESQGGS